MNYRYWMLIVVGFSLAACSGKQDKKPDQKNRVIPAEGIVAGAGSLDQTMNITGTLLANEEVNLHPEINGLVLAIHFTEGSPVNKGDLLVKLKDDELQAQLRKLKVNEEQTASEEKRKRKLLDIKGISQEEYDISLSQLNGIRADIDLLRAQIDRTEIRAPFAGIIGLRSVSPGSMVTPATLLARLVQLKPIKLEFNVPEKLANRLQKGQDITFQAEGGKTSFTARVYALEPAIDPSTRSRKIRAICDKHDGSLQPGGFARVSVPSGPLNESLLLPAQSVIPRLNGYDVLCYSAGQVKRVPVELGYRGDSLVEISSGIASGDTIITTALMQLKAGMKVQLTRVHRSLSPKGGKQ